QTPFYIFTAYVLTYATQKLSLLRGDVLSYVLLGSVASMVAIPFWGHLSDRVSRRKLVGVGCVAMMIWPFLYFIGLDTRATPWLFLAIVWALPIHDIQYGPQAAVIAEASPPSVRYSGSSLGYQLASLTAGGPAPLVALWLEERFKSSS